MDGNYKIKITEGYNELIADIMQLFRWYPNEYEAVEKFVDALSIALHDVFQTMPGKQEEIIDLIIAKLKISNGNDEPDTVFDSMI